MFPARLLRQSKTNQKAGLKDPAFFLCFPKEKAEVTSTSAF